MTDAMLHDLHGYGRRRPLAAWPGAARVAVSFVLNYEEGGERNVLDGDAHAENYLVPEIVGLPPIAGRSPPRATTKVDGGLGIGFEDRIKSLAIKEAYRLITIREGDRLESVREVDY
jgi:hypothetical protein